MSQITSNLKIMSDALLEIDNCINRGDDFSVDEIGGIASLTKGMVAVLHKISDKYVDQPQVFILYVEQIKILLDLFSKYKEDIPPSVHFDLNNALVKAKNLAYDFKEMKVKNHLDLLFGENNTILSPWGEHFDKKKFLDDFTIDQLLVFLNTGTDMKNSANWKSHGISKQYFEDYQKRLASKSRSLIEECGGT